MSKTKGEQFAGVTVAGITPFKGGEVDYDGLKQLVDCTSSRAPTASPAGTTGESPTLDHEEHERVIAGVSERAAGRIKVMPGTGSNSTREAIRLTKFAKKAGAQVLMVGPYYNKPTQEGYYRHFAAVAEACDLPIVLYNIPGRTGVEHARDDRPDGGDPQHRRGQGGGSLPIRRRTSPRCATSRSCPATTA